MSDDLFDDEPIEEFSASDNFAPRESPKARAARIREENKRQQAEAEARIAREKLKAELRAELEAEMKAEQAAQPVVEAASEPTTGTYRQNFWSISPYHEPRVVRPGTKTMIHFKNGFYRSENEADTQLILEHLSDRAWPEDIPEGQPVYTDPKTNYAPRSWRAQQEFLKFSVAENPI